MTTVIFQDGTQTTIHARQVDTLLNDSGLNEVRRTKATESQTAWSFTFSDGAIYAIITAVHSPAQDAIERFITMEPRRGTQSKEG